MENHCTATTVQATTNPILEVNCHTAGSSYNVVKLEYVAGGLILLGAVADPWPLNPGCTRKPDSKAAANQDPSFNLNKFILSTLY